MKSKVIDLWKIRQLAYVAGPKMQMEMDCVKVTINMEMLTRFKFFLNFLRGSILFEFQWN